MKILRSIGSVLLFCFGTAICVILWTVTQGSVVETMPDNASLFLHYPSNTYASPICVAGDETAEIFADVSRVRGKIVDMKMTPDASVVSLMDARQAQANPDPKCRDGSGFFGSSQSTIKGWLGFKPASRWDTDGNWNW